MIYLDYAATTPLDPRVAARMCEWLSGGPGNAASAHAAGQRAARAVEEARAQVATRIGAAPESVIWTSGATESNNLAILGAARANVAKGRHVLTVATAHKSVLEPCRQLAREGFEVEALAVDTDGALPRERLLAALRPDTVLVALLAVNNETGVVQDLDGVGQAVHAVDALLHVDAAQAAGRVAIDVERWGADCVALSAHKAYGPLGVGALYVRRLPRRRLQPLLFGGGQERGLRPGTLPVHQIVGMGEAFRLLDAGAPERAQALRQRLLDGLGRLGGVVWHGREDGVPHIVNLGFLGVHGEALAAALPELATATSSACTAASGEPSHVLKAMGVPDALAQASLRFSFGHDTEEPVIDAAVQQVSAALQRLRASSPLWRRHTQGADWEALYGYPIAPELPSRSEQVAGSPVASGEHRGTGGRLETGTLIDLWLRVDGAIIAGARAEVFGGPPAMAGAEWLCGHLPGLSLAAAGSITGRAIAEAADLPPAAAGQALVLEDALKYALEHFNGRHEQ